MLIEERVELPDARTFSKPRTTTKIAPPTGDDGELPEGGGPYRGDKARDGKHDLAVPCAGKPVELAAHATSPRREIFHDEFSIDAE